MSKRPAPWPARIEEQPTNNLGALMMVHSLYATHENASQSLARLSLTELVRHVVSLHHRYLREVLPEIETRLQQMVSSGSGSPELMSLFRLYSQERNQHMRQQEEWVFPLLCGLDTGHFFEQNPADLSLLLSPVQRRYDPLLERLQEMVQASTPDSRRELLLQELNELAEDAELHWEAEALMLFPRALAQAARRPHRPGRAGHLRQ